MAKIQGSVPVGGFFAPTDDTDTFGVSDPRWGIGGMSTWEQWTDILTIPAGRRRLGMIVFNEDKSATDTKGGFWTLINNPTGNTTVTSDWKVFWDEVSTVVNVTYDELVSLRDASGLQTGYSYRLTDFKTIYKQPESLIISNSAQGISDGLDTQVEELLLFAVGNDKLNDAATSFTYPSDVIHYNIDLDLTDGTASHKGGIYYRKDAVIGVEMRYDWRTVKFRRYALTADAWVIGSTYAKGDTCRVGNRLFVSLKNANVGKEPVTTDGDDWMTVFYDLLSRPDLEYNTAKSVTPDVEDRMQTYGFKVDGTKHKDFYTVAFLDEPDNSTCVHVGTGETISQIVFLNNLSVDDNGVPLYASVLTNNVILLENTPDVLPTAGNISITDLDLFKYNTFRPYKNFQNVVSTGINGGFLNVYLTGWLYSSTLSKVWVVYNSFVRGLSYVTTHNNGIKDSIINLQKDDLSTDRMLNSSKTHIENSLIYSKGWVHAIGSLAMINSVLSKDGKLSNSPNIELINSHIHGDMTSSSVTSETGYHRIGPGSGSNLTVNGTAINSLLIDTFNLTIDGDLDGVELRQVEDVTIPANVSLTEVKFTIPHWQGKNTWSGDPLVLINKVVNRKWADVEGAATQEKLWYEEVDQNGTVTYKELK